ncbi:MAG: PorT family protein [Bacteroidetes bacterium]|nr:PorT family protein [Bacteroidota bacterium]
MFHLYRNQVILTSLFCILGMVAQAQELNPLYDRKPIRFGFGIMGNTAKMKFAVDENNLNYDSLKRIESVSYPGFGLGGLVNFRLAEHWDLRTMLNIQFARRDLNYYFKNDIVKTAQMESTYMEIPLTFEYKSVRHKNVRLYVLGGLTYRFDFTSDVDTDRSNTKPIVAMYPHTFSYDVGFGLDLYYDFFKFSPEIKLSNGLGNQLVPDEYIYASSLKRISPKLIQVSFIFQ